MRQTIKFGKYLLLERIAVGGMAEIFVAKAFGAEGFERLLAIKKILPTMGEDAEFIRMFVDEARIAVQLAHPNIVHVLELGRHEGTLFIAMEYISGRDLRQLMERFRKRQQPVPAPQACFIVAEVCEALDYAHRKRDANGRPLAIVHRDVSPQNVLVTFEGGVKLIDFGIAKAESRLQKTQSGILKGKFSYMSPEQVKGLPVDGRSDVFACGVLLWELLAGEKLFSGDSDFAILERIRQGVIPPLRGCPDELEKVVDKALANDPAERYPSASALHDDLRRFTLQSGNVFGARQLAEWLRDELRREWEDEQQRVRRWLQVATPSLEAHELPTMKIGDEELLAAEKELQTRRLAVHDAAPVFDVSDERTVAPRQKRNAALSRPERVRSSLLRKIAYALVPVTVAVAGVLWAVVSLGDGIRPGKLVVTALPPVAADLVIDGRPSGQVPPFVRTLPAGKHHVEVRAEGYRPFTTVVEVPAGGRPLELTARLVAEGPLQVEGVVLTRPK